MEIVMQGDRAGGARRAITTTAAIASSPSRTTPARDSAQAVGFVARPRRRTRLQGQAHRCPSGAAAVFPDHEQLVITAVQRGAYTGEDDICRQAHHDGREDVAV